MHAVGTAFAVTIEAAPHPAMARRPSPGDHVHMGFDLYVFDMDSVPDDEEELGEMLEESRGWGAPPTPRLSAFIEELASSFSSLDDDPDESPWASWPLHDTVLDGRGVALNIVWSHAGPMSRELRNRCNAAGLVLYDPQEGLVIRPFTGGVAERPRPRWWPRRGG